MHETSWNIWANVSSPLLPQSSAQKGWVYFRSLRGKSQPSALTFPGWFVSFCKETGRQIVKNTYMYVSHSLWRTLLKTSCGAQMKLKYFSRNQQHSCPTPNITLWHYTHNRTGIDNTLMIKFCNLVCFAFYCKDTVLQALSGMHEVLDKVT